MAEEEETETTTVELPDTAAEAANITITADGTAELAGITVTLNSGGGITLDADTGTIQFADGGATHSIVWNGVDNSGNMVSSGIYIYRMLSNDFTKSHRITLMK